jgi:NAD(P)-dependent dehydrogenase (short-subunit alcohol dehydrogenase family)
MADEEMDALGATRGVDREAAYRIATAAVPLQRPAIAEEVADAIAYLLSPAASYINAAVIPIDGGHSAVDVGALAFRDAAPAPSPS